MNRLSNTKNQFQGDTKKVLCICSAGILRSPTLAHLLFKKFGYNTRAVGSTKEYALIPVDEVLLFWADEVIYIENSNKLEVELQFGSDCHENSFVLDIPDIYGYMDKELQNILLNKYKEIVLSENNEPIGVIVKEKIIDE